MRYYDILIPDSKLRYTSHPNGNGNPPDPGALQVEMDIFQFPEATPGGDAATYVRLWGIPLTQLAQAFDLNNKTIQVFGGMGKGLPLANPSQAGMLVQGRINQAFGNWIGTAMTLDLLLTAGTTAQGSDAAQDFSANWKAGTTLDTNIKQVLNKVYPGVPVDVKIRPNLVLPNDEPFFYGILSQFARYIEGISRKIANNNPQAGPWGDPDNILSQKYDGVQIYYDGQKFRVYDQSTQSQGGTKQINFTDLIGQVTWISPGTVQATCVMRGDLKVGDVITLPQGQIVTTAAAMSAYAKTKQGSIFQGTFQIQKIRHVGNYKQPDAQAWVTILDCTIQ